jgi:hypothetical protein
MRSDGRVRRTFGTARREMNRGLRLRLTRPCIFDVVAAVLAIALVVGLTLGWFVGASWVGRHRVEAEMQSLCESVPLGADTPSLLRMAGERGITLSHEADGATYTSRRMMAGCNEISCEFRVDNRGTVVARTFHPLGPIRMRRAASAPALSG